jgi:hypothetical protein
MRAELLTSDGNRVGFADTPPFNKPPDILIWGERFFQLDKLTEGHVEPQYREAFTYFVPQGYVSA